MELFLKYLKDRRKVMAMLVVFVVVFTIVFSLYHLPFEAVLYPALLCAVIGVIYMVSDFHEVQKKHLLLTEMKNLTAAMLGEFEYAADICEEDYREIISSLKKEIAGLETKTDIRYQDMMDYYTVWVHQIKTPIASMRLTLQNEDTPLARKLQADLFRIEQYVAMVLTYLRLDSDTSDYVFREYSVDEMIKHTIKKFSHEFIGRKISCFYEPIEKRLVTDDKWFCFVLEQLVSNALKYTREGSVKIYLADQNTLCIEDSGIGIAPEDLPRIFQKGYTGYNGRADKKASGIGLYLCKRVCKNLGIGIRVESEIGKGTIVKLDLKQYQIRKE